MTPATLDLGRPRSGRELLRTALTVWTADLGTFLAIGAGVVVTVDVIMGIGLGQISGRYRSNPGTGPLVIEQAISTFVTTPLITAMLVSALLAIGAGRAPSIRTAVSSGLDAFAPVLVAVAIYIAGVIGGLSLFVVPGVIVYVSWYFVTQAVVVDGARGLRAVARSAELVRGSWRRVFVIVLAIHLLIGIPSYLVGLAVSEAARSANSAAVELAGLMVVDSFAISLQALAGTLLYFDLRARRQSREQPAGPGSPQTPQAP